MCLAHIMDFGGMASDTQRLIAALGSHFAHCSRPGATGWVWGNVASCPCGWRVTLADLGNGAPAE